MHLRPQSAIVLWMWWALAPSGMSSQMWLLIQPQGLLRNQTADRFASPILLPLPTHSETPLHLTGKNRDACGSEMSQVSEELACRREFLRRGKKRCAAVLTCPSSSPRCEGGAFHKEPKGHCQTSQGLKDHQLCSLCLRSLWPSPDALFFFFFFLWRGKLSADTGKFSLAGPGSVWLFATPVLRAGCYDEGRGPFPGIILWD